MSTKSKGKSYFLRVFEIITGTFLGTNQKKKNTTRKNCPRIRNR